MKAATLAALLAVACLPSHAQPAPADAGVCVPAARVQSRDLHGFWEVRWSAPDERGLLLLEQSREFEQGLIGSLSRSGEKRLVAGDLVDGEFTLEESPDATTISANWTGEWVDSTCAKEIRGIWKDARSGLTRGFVLRRSTGW